MLEKLKNALLQRDVKLEEACEQSGVSLDLLMEELADLTAYSPHLYKLIHFYEISASYILTDLDAKPLSPPEHANAREAEF